MACYSEELRRSCQTSMAKHKKLRVWYVIFVDKNMYAFLPGAISFYPCMFLIWIVCAFQTSDEYRTIQSGCHQRAAERILSGCLKNGGLYIKLGQGLVSMNHILPKEYLNTLVVLQDQALHRGTDEVGQSGLWYNGYWVSRMHDRRNISTCLWMFLKYYIIPEWILSILNN